MDLYLLNPCENLILPSLYYPSLPSDLDPDVEPMKDLNRGTLDENLNLNFCVLRNPIREPAQRLSEQEVGAI